MSWFEVDKGGLQQLYDGKDKGFIMRELVQNALDEPEVTVIDINVEPVPGKPQVRIIVEDDAPEGFTDIRHAWTLFAKTRKRPDPEKRGRFNLGEKQCLSIAKTGRIITTTGVVDFLPNGKRSYRKTEVTEKGSIIDLIIPMTRAEMLDMLKAVQTFIVPPHVKLTLNSEEIHCPVPVVGIEATLTTEYENDEGQWRRSQRKTPVDVYEPRNGEIPMLYEMGLPVVELEGGDPWHLNVHQRVPLNSDRDNVSPAFIRDIRAEVLNKLADKLTEDQAAESWVSDATDDERIESEAVRTVIKKRFGDNAVVADPNDPESRERAIMAGCTIVPARAMSRSTWEHVREAGAVPSTSARYGSVEVEATPIPKKDWNINMGTLAGVARRIASAAIDKEIEVRFVKSRADSRAQWSNGIMPTMTFNVTRLGNAFLRPNNLDNQIELIVHELGHKRGGHLDASYIALLCKIAGILFKEDRRAMLGDINNSA